MDATFMRAYRDLVIATCHKHGAPATGGMTPIAPPGYDSLDHASRKMVCVCVSVCLSVCVWEEGQ